MRSLCIMSLCVGNGGGGGLGGEGEARQELGGGGEVMRQITEPSQQ